MYLPTRVSIYSIYTYVHYIGVEELRELGDPRIDQDRDEAVP
jgi:hypothetical protein